jgi:endonuclease YncB( thermonuclease family)
MIVTYGLVALCLLLPALPQAEPEREYAGEVVAVADGETLVVLSADGRLYRISLASIKAPRSVQPFSEESLRNLAALALGKAVTFRATEEEERVRDLTGVVLVEGNDLGLAQVRAGFALAEERAGPYAEAEREARERRSGMWASPFAAQLDESGVRCSRIGSAQASGLRRPRVQKSRIMGAAPIAIERVVGNRQKKEFYRASCSEYRKTPPEQRVLFNTLQEAVSNGYREKKCS